MSYEYLWPKVREVKRCTLCFKELEVVTLAAQGKKSHEIAREMGISESTVSGWYLNRIACKLRLGAWNSALVTQWAIWNGLIDLNGCRLVKQPLEKLAA